MERELWEALCRLTGMFYNRLSRAIYTDEVIIAVYWWAVVHDRPVNWACDTDNWPPELRDFRLPSQSTMSRRLRRATLEQLMYDVENALLSLTCLRTRWVRVIDAKPLPVGGPSKDADAAWGRGAGGLQKGYKLHVVWGEGPLPIAWALAPLNVSERRMAMGLVQDLPGEGYLLGDRQYDAAALYDAAAHAGYQLVALPQRTGRALGHRRQSPHRLRSLALLKTPFGKALYRCRCHIEHCFAQLTTFVGGLGPLPFWVRRFNRVRLWVHSKLLLNAVHYMKFHPTQVLADA
jgi:hypothetical protein